MSGATDFQDLTDRLLKADRVLWLGRLTWYGVSEVKVKHEELVRILVKAGLGAYLPPLPLDVDVFKRVCSAAERKRVPIAGNPSAYENYLIRDSGRDKDKVVKRLVRETVDGNLSYETELCSFTFHKGASHLSISCTNSDPVTQEIADEIKANYASHQGTINSYGVRELIRKILLDNHAVNVRGKGGGVYFIAEARGKTLDALELLAAECPGEILFHTLPLLDDTKQREMLQNAFESEVVDEIEEILAEVDEMEKAGKKFTADRVNGYMTRLDDLQGKWGEYSDLLETNLSSTASSLKIFRGLIMRLMTLV